MLPRSCLALACMGHRLLQVRILLAQHLVHHRRRHAGRKHLDVKKTTVSAQGIHCPTYVQCQKSGAGVMSSSLSACTI